ncbi:hypothetical protein [Streptomyces chartreusis]
MRARRVSPLVGAAAAARVLLTRRGAALMDQPTGDLRAAPLA